jgi:hypothetical protein
MSSKAPLDPIGVLEVVDQSISILERLGGVDERTKTLLKDVVRDAVLSAAGGSAPKFTTSEEVTLLEFLQELGCSSYKATRIVTNKGKELRCLYREENGRDPKYIAQLIGDRPIKHDLCQAFLYERTWLMQKEEMFQDMIASWGQN